MVLAVPDLTDGVVRLRVPERRDVDAIYAACQDPDIIRFTRVPYPYSRLHAQTFVRNSAQELRSGTAAHLVIADAGADELLGACGLIIDRMRRAGEVGYWVAPGVRRRGAASRAVRLLTRWAHGDLGLVRVQLMADVRNAASQAVARTCGFQREGVLRSYEDRLGDRIDYVMFSLLRGEDARGL
jgi:RimJ/RimL family protein N-acetyltransferase